MSQYTIRALPEKFEVLRQAREAPSTRAKLRELGVPKSTYYDWKRKGAVPKSRAPRKVWNRTPRKVERAIRTLRESGDPLKSSPMRIMECLEHRLGYVMAESGVKSVLSRQPDYRPRSTRKKGWYRIRPRAEKFLSVVCVDELEWLRWRPRDTFALNWTDEYSSSCLRVTVFGRKPNRHDVVAGLDALFREHGRHPRMLRSDNAQIFKSRKLRGYARRHGIVLDYIEKGRPQENWPVESSNGMFRDQAIRRNGFSTVQEWQREFERLRYYWNTYRRLRSDEILRTPREIAFAFTTPQTQARLKRKLLRKHGRKLPSRFIPPSPSYPLPVSEMCVT